MELSKDVQVAVETSPTLAIIVTDTASEIQAATNLRELQRRIKLVEDEFAEPKNAAHLAHKKIVELENKLLKPLKDIVSKIKLSLSAYNQIQRQKQIEAEAEQAKILEAALETGNLALIPEVQDVPKNLKLEGMRTVSYMIIS